MASVLRFNDNSKLHITIEIWEILLQKFSGKIFPDSWKPEKLGRQNKPRNLQGEITIACHNRNYSGAVVV